MNFCCKEFTQQKACAQSHAKRLRQHLESTHWQAGLRHNFQAAKDWPIGIYARVVKKDKKPSSEKPTEIIERPARRSMIARKKGQHFQFEFVAQPPQGLESVQVVLPEAHHSSPYEHVVDLIHGSTVDTASDPHACPSWTGHNDVNIACCRNCNERWTIPDHVSTKTTKFQSRATSPGTSPVSVENYWVRQNIPIGIAVSKTPSNEAKISDDGNVYDSEFGDSDVSLVSLSTAQNGNNKSRVMSASRKIQAVGVPGEERVILDQMPSIFSPGPRSYHIGGTTLTAYQTMQDESDSRWNDQGKMKRRGWHSPCPTSPS